MWLEFRSHILKGYGFEIWPVNRLFLQVFHEYFHMRLPGFVLRKPRLELFSKTSCSWWDHRTFPCTWRMLWIKRQSFLQDYILSSLFSIYPTVQRYRCKCCIISITLYSRPVIQSARNMKVWNRLYLTVTVTSKSSVPTCYLDERCVPHFCHLL